MLSFIRLFSPALVSRDLLHLCCLVRSCEFLETFDFQQTCNRNTFVTTLILYFMCSVLLDRWIVCNRLRRSRCRSYDLTCNSLCPSCQFPLLSIRLIFFPQEKQRPLGYPACLGKKNYVVVVVVKIAPTYTARSSRYDILFFMTSFQSIAL